MSQLTIRQARPEEAAWLQTSFDTQMGWKKRAGYFAGMGEKQAQGQLILFIATVDDAYVGHLKVVWQPTYPYFRKHNIPEIQDLNVLPAHRRQGIATQLLDTAEATIQQRSSKAGIGFGLYADYGAAQRLYILRGYVPDGQGVYYRGGYPQGGATVRLDDDLVLYLVKAL